MERGEGRGERREERENNRIGFKTFSLTVAGGERGERGETSEDTYRVRTLVFCEERVCV